MIAAVAAHPVLLVFVLDSYSEYLFAKLAELEVYVAPIAAIAKTAVLVFLDFGLHLLENLSARTLLIEALFARWNLAGLSGLVFALRMRIR